MPPMPFLDVAGNMGWRTRCVIAAEDTVEAPSRIGRFDASALAWSHCQRHAAAWAAAAQLLSALRTRGAVARGHPLSEALRGRVAFFRSDMTSSHVEAELRL
ncbi:unnamed protein product [Durusdinium trenchii]|uniref:Uncharacterized protein n=1 Tax=Durusdinium trenchii TaxID=1381693 RepID=A0ABP0HYQ1_9DINO